MKRLLSVVLLAVVLLTPARPSLPVTRLGTARPATRTTPPRPCPRAARESAGDPARCASRRGR